MSIGKRRRPLVRDETTTRDAKLVIIATEGEKTEGQYFVNFNDSRVRIIMLPAINGHSSPQAVYTELEKFAEKYDIAEGDEFWLVVDADHWVAKGKLQPVAKMCRQNQYQLAVSNPCFELWLLLHHENLKKETDTQKCKGVIKQLKENVYHNKSKLDYSKYADHVADAIVRASKITGDGDIPENPGTNVYKLVQSLLKL